MAKVSGGEAESPEYPQTPIYFRKTNENIETPGYGDTPVQLQKARYIEIPDSSMKNPPHNYKDSSKFKFKKLVKKLKFWKRPKTKDSTVKLNFYIYKLIFCTFICLLNRIF